MTLDELDRLIEFLQQTPEVVQQTVAELSPSELTWKSSAEEFSALEHVCHLRDIEREGYQERIRRLLEEDEPDLPDIDGDKLALERRYNEQDLAIALEDFGWTRQENMETIKALKALVPGQLNRCGNLEGVGRVTLGQLLELMRGHDEEHREKLRNLREEIVNGRNPFLKIRARGLLKWLLCGFVLLVVGMAIIVAGVSLDKTTSTNLSVTFLYIWVLYWVHLESQKVGIDIHLFLQRTMTTGWLHLIGLVICLFIFALGSIYLFGYLLTYIWPSLFESGVLNTDGLFDPNHSILNQAIGILIIIVIAPVTEEILFRGILLNRWITKWGMRKSILATSLAFAILHIDFLGAFIFAICMAILYLKTRTLLVPIAAHALNNTIAVAVNFWWAIDVETSASSTIDEFRSAVWFGAICFAMTLPILILYINRNWPKKDAMSPYLLQWNEERLRNRC